MNLFIELRHHSKLAEQRNPMYDKSRFAKLWVYLMIAFWAGYLIFFGSMFAFALQDASVEPYHIINSGLLIFMALDFVIRLAFQKTPSQEVKPYALLPVSRKRIFDCLLLRSGLDAYNLFWLFFFMPFAILCVTRFYGIGGVITYNLGIWLLMVVNNYWYLLCRMLMSERFIWVLLPVVVYAGLGCVLFIPDDSPVFDWFVDIGEGYIHGNLLTFVGTLAVLFGFYLLCRMEVSHTVYRELNKVEDTTVKVKNVSEYSFLNRYGMVGEYMKLELKLILRNKVCRQALYTVGCIVLMFSALIAFSDVYQGGMKDFLVMYNFVIFSLFLTTIMSYEGNYMDGLMSRKESILALLEAKFYVYGAGQIIPFCLLIPAMVTGNVPFLTCLSWLFFVPGFVYFCLFQMAVYNTNTVNLTAKTTQRNMGTGMQNLISGLAFGVPILMLFALRALFEEETVSFIFIFIGLAFIFTRKWWIKNVYHRFMKRRYTNMEGFRNSRQKG